MNLDENVIAKISLDVQQLRGRELCGYLTLDSHEQQEFYALINRSHDAGSFWVSKGDYQRLARHFARRNLRILAFVHSHSSGLELSREDSICLRASDIPWVIVGIVDGELQSRFYKPGDAAP